MTPGSSREIQNARRSQRLPLQIPIHVECFIQKQGRFAADAIAIAISPHGALARLPWDIPPEKTGGLNGSMQHLLEVFLRGR